MGISVLRSVDGVCAGCRGQLDEPLWVVIDLIERPDLRTMLASDAVAILSCPRCGARMLRTEPLLVTRLSPAAPVLLAFPYDRLQSGGDLAAASQPLIQGVCQRMGNEVRDVPGPVLLVPFDALAVAARRDLVADIHDIEAARADVGGEGNRAAMNYALFLQDVLASTSDRRLNLVLNQLNELQSANELERLVDEYPELATQAARDDAAAWLARASGDEERHVARARLEMLQLAARGDYDAAWRSYERAGRELLAKHVGPRIDELWRDFDERADDLDAALAAGEALLKIAQTGAQEFEIEVSSRMAAVLLAMPGLGRAERVERAIELLKRTLELLDEPANADRRLFRAQTLTNLGFAFSVRHYGDPLINQERAIALNRQVLALITMDDDGDSWALAQTNLGHSLLEHTRERQPNEPRWEESPEPPEEMAEIDEAIDHFHAALRWRSFERDPRDWAFTQVNLGLAFNRRPSGDRSVNLRRSLEYYEYAERGFAAAGDRVNHAQVLHNLSSVKLALARLESTPEDERQELLHTAVDSARASVSERTLDEAPIDAGRAWRQLGESLRAVGDVDAAIDAYDHALRGLTVEVAPRHARDTARALGDLAAESGRRKLTAQAYETAAEAAALAWEARATFGGRIDELHNNLNVFRWAAYALAKVGRLKRAVEILELGRARELARWMQADLIDLARLGELDPQLADRYTALRLALSQLERGQRTGGHVDGAEVATVAEQFAATAVAIRALPGFDTFLRMPKFSDAVAALGNEDALVYVVTSPDGSLALVVTHGSDGGEVQLVEASTLRSRDLFRLYMRSDFERETLDGYLIAHAGLQGSLKEALARFAEMLGPDLLKPLRDALAAAGVRTVCLIPISLLGVLPLHALGWNENGTERCLLDEFTVLFAPSALVRSVCLQRAARATKPRRAVVVGNPLPQATPLPGAELEAAMVAQGLTAEELSLLVGTEATKEAVVTALPGATHVHLACHGAAAILDRPMNAALSLGGNQSLHAEEILELDGFAPRLVVASACETGVIQGYETADEALTLGAMFLAAGATGVVSTLWSISDLATALMMSRFYELLAQQREEQPGTALREAQLWLRELTVERAAAYIAAHPLLSEHGAARDGELRTGSQAATARPFSEITTWGAFILSGA